MWRLHIYEKKSNDIIIFMKDINIILVSMELEIFEWGLPFLNADTK